MNRIKHMMRNLQTRQKHHEADVKSKILHTCLSKETCRQKKSSRRLGFLVERHTTGTAI